MSVAPNSRRDADWRKSSVGEEAMNINRERFLPISPTTKDAPHTKSRVTMDPVTDGTPKEARDYERRSQFQLG